VTLVVVDRGGEKEFFWAFAPKSEGESDAKLYVNPFYHFMETSDGTYLLKGVSRDMPFDSETLKLVRLGEMGLVGPVALMEAAKYGFTPLAAVLGLDFANCLFSQASTHVFNNYVFEVEVARKIDEIPEDAEHVANLRRAGPLSRWAYSALKAVDTWNQLTAAFTIFCLTGAAVGCMIQIAQENDPEEIAEKIVKEIKEYF